MRETDTIATTTKTQNAMTAFTPESVYNQIATAINKEITTMTHEVKMIEKTISIPLGVSSTFFIMDLLIRLSPRVHLDTGTF